MSIEEMIAAGIKKHTYVNTRQNQRMRLRLQSESTCLNEHLPACHSQRDKMHTKSMKEEVRGNGVI